MCYILLEKLAACVRVCETQKCQATSRPPKHAASRPQNDHIYTTALKENNFIHVPPMLCNTFMSDRNSFSTQYYTSLEFWIYVIFRGLIVILIPPPLSHKVFSASVPTRRASATAREHAGVWNGIFCISATMGVLRNTEGEHSLWPAIQEGLVSGSHQGLCS